MSAVWTRTESCIPHLSLPRVASCALFVLALNAGCAPRPSTVTLLKPPVAGLGPASCPTIALDPVSHDLCFAWLASPGGDAGPRLWFSRSTDAGVTWSPPVAVSVPGEPVDESLESGPRLACDARGRVAILWSTGPGPKRPGEGPGELRFARSLDRGGTWSTPVTLHADTSTRRVQGHQALVVSDQGRLLAAWVDRATDSGAVHHEPGEPATVHVSSSLDFGDHWSEESLEWTRACPCSRVSLGHDIVGGAYAAFRRHYDDGSCDVALARPGGPSVRSFHDRWTAEGCPDSGPGFELARDGSIRVAWYTGSPGRVGVWFRQNLPETYDSTAVPMPLLTGASLPPLHVSIGDAGMAGTLIACDGDSTGAGPLSLFRVEASGRRVVERLRAPGTRAFGLQVATSNRSRRAFVAWTDIRGSHATVGLLRWDVGR